MRFTFRTTRRVAIVLKAWIAITILYVGSYFAFSEFDNTGFAPNVNIRWFYTEFEAVIHRPLAMIESVIRQEPVTTDRMGWISATTYLVSDREEDYDRIDSGLGE